MYVCMCLEFVLMNSTANGSIQENIIQYWASFPDRKAIYSAFTLRYYMVSKLEVT